MRLKIRHKTTYSYARAVVLQPHRMVLCPRGSHELSVLATSLSCSPTAELDWTQDVFGNLIATGTFTEPAAELVITGVMNVEQSAVAWPVFRIAPAAHSFPFAYSDDDVINLGALLVPEHADPDGTLQAWARAFVHRTPTDTLSLLKDINAGILGPVAYRTRDEEGTQTALETLAKASGSCRDIAALFIEAVRHLGFGARAVSGYLFDPDAAAGDPGSTHAWAEVYLPAAGWIAFDPTHRRLGGASLIPVAVARSNKQIMPIVGGYVGAAEDFIAMNVEVKRHARVVTFRSGGPPDPSLDSHTDSSRSLRVEATILAQTFSAMRLPHPPAVGLRSSSASHPPFWTAGSQKGPAAGVPVHSGLQTSRRCWLRSRKQFKDFR